MDLEQYLEEDRLLIEKLDLCDRVSGFCGSDGARAAVADTRWRILSFSAGFPEPVLKKILKKNDIAAGDLPLFFDLRDLPVCLWLSDITIDGELQGYLAVTFDPNVPCSVPLHYRMAQIKSFCFGPLASYIQLCREQFESEQHCSKKEARLRHAENSLRVLREQHHEILGENIRQREELEKINEQLVTHKQQLEEYGRSLEEKVLERTAELRKAKERAEESDRFKSTFLANMSHEMRTPLNAILGFVEMAVEQPLSGEQKQYLDKVTRGGQHLLHLLNDILDLSKLEARQMQIESIPASLDQVFSDIQLSADTLVSRDNKNVAVRPNRDRRISSFILCDPRRLYQVMNNLISNAAKFTESGYIEYGASLKKDDMLLFYVSDSGIGIPADKQKRIFESFQQADNSTTRKYGGTGLGLTITKNLVELMGGTIRVESEPGHGATFYFTLPYHPAEPPHDEKPGMGESAEQARGHIADPGRVHILLVEDNPDNQLLAKTILEKQGYRLTVANDGIEAVEAYKKGADTISLILMDMQMPNMGGLEATGHIRRLEKEKNSCRVPIIALTAGAMEGEREHCIKGGCDDYLSKPIKKKKLYSMILHYCSAGT